MSGRGGKRGGVGCTGFLLAVLVVAMLASLFGQAAAPGTARHGAGDTNHGGRRMAWRLLDELGLEPRLWVGSPEELADAAVELLWLQDLPAGYRSETTFSWEDDGDPTWTDGRTEVARDRRAVLALQEHVVTGGDVLVPVRGDGSVELAAELLSLPVDDLLDHLVVGDLDRGDRLSTGLRKDGPDGRPLGVRGRLPEHWRSMAAARDRGLLLVEDALPADLAGLLEVELLPAGRAALSDEPTSRFAVVLRRPDLPGQGRVVLLAGDAMLDNEALPEADNALALVRLVEHLDRRVWFDETLLVPPVGGSWLGYVFGPTLWPLTLAALFLGALAAWRTAPRRGFPLELREEAGGAPLERARGRASLLLRAGRVELLARDLRAGVRARLGGDDEAWLRRRLEAAAPSERREAWLAAAHRALGVGERTPPITSPAELTELGATLAAIEARIHEA